MDHECEREQEKDKRLYFLVIFPRQNLPLAVLFPDESARPAFFISGSNPNLVRQRAFLGIEPEIRCRAG